MFFLYMSVDMWKTINNLFNWTEFLQPFQIFYLKLKLIGKFDAIFFNRQIFCQFLSPKYSALFKVHFPFLRFKNLFSGCRFPVDTGSKVIGNLLPFIL